MDNTLKAAIIGGCAVIVAAFIPIAFANHLFSPGNTTPSPTITSSSPTSTGSSTAFPSVFYTGQRTLSNGYYANLDNPSWAVSTSNSAGATFDLGAYSTGRFEADSGDWGVLSTPGASGYAACASFTAFNTSLMPASDLPPGTRLCVKTGEGRIGLLKVLSTSNLNNDPMITFQVTVWNNHTSSRSSTSASASQPSPASPSVFYTGQRTLSNGYYANLDNPSWAVSTSNSAGATFDLGAYSTGRFEADSGDWGVLSPPGASGYAACASFTAFNTSLMPASDLPPGTRLCVKTGEGRIGLLNVLSTSNLNNDPMITFQVTVWNNHTSSRSSTSASASQPSPASPSVFYTGQRTLSNGYYANLDNPSWAVSTSNSAG